jgi:hypothetical protein
MTTLLTAFPSRSYSNAELEVLKEVWLGVLADVPNDALNTVAAEYLRSDAQFAPAPGQLRTRAIALLGLNASEIAEAAWIESKEEIYQHNPITDPIAKVVWQRLGIAEWRERDIEKSPERFWQDKFIRAYADSFERHTAGLALPLGGDKVAQLIDGAAARMRGDEQKRIEAGA